MPLYREHFYFSVASALELVAKDPTEKDINFFLFQLRLQSATPRQMWGDRSIAHVSVGCGGLVEQDGRELHENEDSILIPGTWAERSMLGS